MPSFIPLPKSRAVRWGLGIALAVVALAAGIQVGRHGFTWGDDRAAAALLAVELPDPGGKPQRLDQWRGRVLVVNFWATWCVPCREEMPEFIREQSARGSRGLQFVGIAVDQPDKVVRFAEEIGLNYPTLVGGLGAMELSRDLGNRLMALPFTIVLDRQGRVAHAQLGPLKAAQLNDLLSSLLQTS